MAYATKSKNVDLVVGPSILTEDIKDRIAYAIQEYRKTGKKPVSTEFFTQGSAKVSTNIGGWPTAPQADDAVKRKENV